MIEMKKTLLALLVLGSSLAAACGGTDIPGMSGGNKAKATPTGTPFDIGGRACPTGSVLTYENFGEPFMLSHCTGCHSSALDGSGPSPGNRQGAPVGVDFDTYELVRAWGVRIYYRAADTNATMPPKDNIPLDNPLNVDDRTALGDWLACNAPTEADQP